MTIINESRKNIVKKMNEKGTDQIPTPLLNGAIERWVIFMKIKKAESQIAFSL